MRNIQNINIRYGSGVPVPCDLTDYSRQVTRQLKGCFVIFSKNSFYNRTTGTYDGRHEKMSGKEFRIYIEKVYEKYKKAHDNFYISDF